MKEIKDYETNPNAGEVHIGDELLPRVTPNAFEYGYLHISQLTGFWANQSIAFDSVKQRLIFGINDATTYLGVPDARVYVTDLELNRIGDYKKLKDSYHINDMMFSVNYDKLILVPLRGEDDDKEEEEEVEVGSKIMEYPINKIYQNDFQLDPPPIVGESRNLSAYFAPGVEIDALCHAAEKQRYIVKGEEKIIFFDYDFKPRESIDILLNDLHGDVVMSQTIEYYNGYLLHLNARKYEEKEAFKSAYLNVNRSGTSGSMVESYRYPNKSEAEGICNIGNGRYLFTYYECSTELEETELKKLDIEIRLLNFNTPSHTHTLSDVFDLKTLKSVPGTLYVNPQLEGKSYLAPDGSMKKPFPNIEEAVAYGKVFLSEATILLMGGNYGMVELSNVPMNLTLKGLSKEGCLVDRIKISKCRDLRFEDLTFCHSERPFEATSSTVEINHCSFPNGRQSGSGPSGNYGISITKNSTVMLQDCEISHFNSAVNLAASTLYLEGCNALKGTGNLCVIRGENSVIWGAKVAGRAGCTVGSTSLTDCRLDGELVTIPFAPGSMNICRVEASRPVNPETGCYYFEAGAGKTLWWNGSAWVDATGAEYLPRPA